MRTHQLLPIAALLALPLVACAHTLPPEDAVGQTTLTSGSVASTLLGDHQIAEILRAACAAAVEESSMSAPFTPDAKVAEYGRQMNEQYQTALDAEQRIIEESHLVPQRSRTSLELSYDSDTAESHLLRLSGNDFEQAFLAREITSQQKLLRLIDDELLPAVHGDAQRRELLELRPVVAQLLSDAGELRTWVIDHASTPQAM